MARLSFMVLTVALLAACVAGDAAVKVRGKFVDQNGAFYEDCLAKVSYAGKILEEISIVGDFEKTIIFQPVSSDPIKISVSCNGTAMTYEYVVTEMPESFKDYVDIGRVVLKRD